VVTAEVFPDAETLDCTVPLVTDTVLATPVDAAEGD
jgi:hypothetical protein